jgi:hypothetical protein
MKRNYKLSVNERKIVQSVFHAMLWYVVARMLTYPFYAGTEFFHVALPTIQLIPEWLFNIVQAGMIACVLTFVGMVIRRYVKTKELFPLPALFLIVSTVGIYFMQVTTEPTFGILLAAYYHGSQNLAVIFAYEMKKKGLPENLPASRIASQLLTRTNGKYFLILITIGIALYVVIPRVLCTGFGINFDLATLTALTIFGSHHILTESVAWRLRDPKVRQLLI